MTPDQLDHLRETFFTGGLITVSQVRALFEELDSMGVQLQNERQRHAFIIDRVRALHRPDPRHGGLLCEQEYQEYPCDTIRAIGKDS